MTARLAPPGRMMAVATLAACALPVLAAADDAPSLPLWELGAFGTVLSQQAYPGSSQKLDRALALPYFIYRGQYLRADRGNLGVRAIKTDDLELDVGFSGAFGSTSSEVEARQGMPDLGTLVEFGPRLRWNVGPAPGHGRLRAELSLRGVFDLSHQLADKGLSLEPELIYERASRSGMRYSTSVGLVLGDQRLTDTFYGVAPAYATATRPTYTAQGGLIMSRLSFNIGKSVTPDLRVFGFVRWASVEGGANSASPLVRQNVASTLGVGLTYTLARSSTLASD